MMLTDAVMVLLPECVLAGLYPPYPGRYPHHQPLAQPLDPASRFHLVLTNPYPTISDTGEVLPEGGQQAA
jgi:hypothetical protein